MDSCILPPEIVILLVWCVVWERKLIFKISPVGTSLVVQWLRLCTPNSGGLGSIPGQGTRSHMPQLRVRMPQLKIPHAATKTRCSQINIKIYIYINISS